MTVVIGKHIDREGPGVIAEILDEYKIPYKTVDLSKERLLNGSGIMAVVVMGGPQSANDATPAMYNELADVRSILKEGKPYLGICLGMQVLGKAAGGTIVDNEFEGSKFKEKGWRDPDGAYFQLNIMPSGAPDRIFDGIDDPVYPIFHLHGEAVEPSNVALLATGRYCSTQVIKAGPKAYGFQGHIELTPEMYERWLGEDPWLKEMNAAELRQDYKGVKRVYEANGRRIIKNWLRIAGLVR